MYKYIYYHKYKFEYVYKQEYKLDVEQVEEK